MYFYKNRNIACISMYEILTLTDILLLKSNYSNYIYVIMLTNMLFFNESTFYLNNNIFVIAWYKLLFDNLIDLGESQCPGVRKWTYNGNETEKTIHLKII